MKTSKPIMCLFCFLLMYSFVQMANVSHAEEAYPTKIIKFLVPMSAGGPTDAICRKVTEHAEKSLGQKIIVENKPGAGGGIAANILAKSKPDGYTIGAVTSSPFLVVPFFSKIDFDPLNDFTPIVQLFTVTYYLSVTTDSTIKTFEDFMEEGRKRRLLVAGMGNVIGDFALERLARLAKLDLKLVPFGGGAQAVPALLGKQVDALVTSGIHEFVRAGKIRLLVQLTEGPKGEYKDIPRIKEFGYDVDAPGFVGICSPKGLPVHIQTKLEEEFTRVARDPSMIEFMEKIGQIVTFRNSKDFMSYIKESHVRTGEMIKELGLGIYGKEKR